MSDLYLSAPSLLTPIGHSVEAVATSLFSGKVGLTAQQGLLLDETPAWVGKVTAPLSPLPAAFSHLDCRNTRMLRQVLDGLKADIDWAMAEYGQDRIGVVLGSSTAGIDVGEQALVHWQQHRRLPESFNYDVQTLGSVARFASDYLGISGPSYTLSTACSSSGKAFASAWRLIQTGLADAVVVGGVDSLCRLTLNGFSALESVSSKLCSPFSEGRQGINIGEGAAVFLLSRRNSAVKLAGVGESSDGYHISAPDPEGKGAELAMNQALAQAGLDVSNIDYVNLHGTGTVKNDAMEAALVARFFSHKPLVSSSKAQVGHCLGAAGALEAAFCYLALLANTAPPQVWQAPYDSQLPPLNFAEVGQQTPLRHVMSNSYAFGGSNVSVIFSHV
ncbi:beta-ketoacyl-ACP synthase [Gallaecimonas mangrovi]|uniref:beta-ketoacyl-ACP synthase n=1 Tax=Gallaecimonas mangrovi TaxID=2291597 RepID=UPI000E20A11F|nr:beta-ketoacyl-ACP synthase [Gallaecimonas mangrovi]